MGRSITTYNGSITPVSGTLPYGAIKNNPDGTVIDEQSNGDIQQFFQRIAANAGVTLNNVPDNAVNGFQFVQALNKLYSNPDSGLAEAIGASGFVAVKASGMLDTVGTFPYHNVSAGYFYYNGQFVKFIASSYDTTVSGTVSIFISTSDGLPTATVGVNPTSVTDATKFPFANLTTYASALGISTLQQQIALGGWVNTSGQTGGQWAAGAVQPRYRKDGMGRVYLQGQFISLSGSLSTVVDTLLASYRPPVELNFPVVAWNTTAYYTAYIRIQTTGQIVYEPVGSIPSGANWWIDVSSITFLTT